MKYGFLSLSVWLLFCACKKDSSPGGSNNNGKPVSPEVAKVVGTFHISSFTDPNGNLAVYTPQNSPGTIAVTKTDSIHFHFVLTQKTSTGATSTAANDYIFDQITGDGYVHFNRVDAKATARYVNSVGGLTIEINSPEHEILVSLRQ